MAEVDNVSQIVLAAGAPDDFGRKVVSPGL
jgi:hypothetical protein